MNFSGKVGIEAQELGAQRAAEPGEARADREGDGEDRVDLDAEARAPRAASSTAARSRLPKRVRDQRQLQRRPPAAPQITMMKAR